MYVVLFFVVMKQWVNISFVSKENSYRNMWNAWDQLWTSSVSCVCHTNGLKKIGEEYVIHVVWNCQLLKIWKLLVRNCQLTLKLVKDHLHVKWGIIFHILHDSFGARKICTKWIPHSLLYEHGVTTYEDLSTIFKPFHIILIAIVLRKILGVSVPSSNIVSQPEVENEVITKVQKKIAWKSSS
jgi:hypothetical protein